MQISPNTSSLLSRARMRGMFAAAMLAGWTLLASGAQAQPFNINYTLPSAGKVSLAVYDTNGKIVRTLLNASSQTSGAQTMVWDGKNDNGVAVANPSTCTWRVLRTPGLVAKHLMFVGSNFPRGSAYWQSGLGTHYGPRSIAVDGTGVYAGAGNSENTRNALKMNLAGDTCLWSAWQPTPWQGRYAMSVLNGNLYFLQQNGRVAWHSTTVPNRKDQSVGVPTAPDNIGESFDVKDADEPLGDSNDWGEGGDRQRMDMYAADISSTPTVVVSYKNAAKVRWFHATTGAIQATVEDFVEPTGVTVDNNGNVLVLDDGKLIKVTKTGVKTTLISNLTSPWRVDVDRSASTSPTRGYIYIAEQGTSHRVKVFNTSYALVTTIGAAIRQQGLYVRTNFKDIVDITSDNAGGFFVAESSAPRRVARFTAGGAFVKEWYGSQDWVPAISVDPTNPSVAWMINDDTQFMRLAIDYATGTWSIHSTYIYAGLGSGLIDKGAHFGSGGYGNWQVRKRGTVTYLVRRNSIQVLKVDDSNWTIKAVVAAQIGKPGVANSSFLWTDGNGDGNVQETEKQYYGSWGLEGYDQLFKHAPAGFDYFRFEKNGPIVKHGLVSGTNFNSVGAPLYAPLNTATTFAVLPGRSPYDLVYDKPPTIFGRETDTGPLYAAIGAGSDTNPSEWGNAPFTRMYKFSPTGTYEWSVGKHQERPSDDSIPPTPGSIYTFKNVVGVVGGTVVATDFNGGWNGTQPAITYAWDRDGLYVGGLFNNPDLSGGTPSWYYIHNSDNGTGEVCLEPSTGQLLYFASGETDGRIYRISGWTGWTRLSGNFSSTPVPGPIADGTYKIVNRNSGKALDVAGNSTLDGSEIQQYTYSGTTNQRFQFTHLGNGEYKIIASHSLKSLDMPSSNLTNGTLFKQYPYNGGDNQKFLITSLGSGYYKISVKHSAKSLDIFQASTTNGARLQQWDYQGNLNQQWQILAP